jgi:hypothetical protein
VLEKKAPVWSKVILGNPPVLARIHSRSRGRGRVDPSAGRTPGDVGLDAIGGSRGGRRPHVLGDAIASPDGRRPRGVGGGLVCWESGSQPRVVDGGLVCAGVVRLVRGAVGFLAKRGLAFNKANPTSLSQSGTLILVSWTLQILRI